MRNMFLPQIVSILTLFLISCTNKQQPVIKQQPNVLWILTDDQRYDGIRAFNQMLHGREMSELGYVESPNVDKLAEMGTTYINTYCQAQGCAPSRASMHFGRYPFRSGVYAFEYHNNNSQNSRPHLPEQMEALGYQTTHIGKLGFRLKTIKEGKSLTPKVYQTDIDSKYLASQKMCDWSQVTVTEVEGEKLDKPVRCHFMLGPDGEYQYMSEDLEKVASAIKGMAKKTKEKYDLLRFYNSKRSKSYSGNTLVGGVSSQPAGKTRDGYYASVFLDYLKTENKTFQVGAKSFKGVDTSKPLFCHLGFDFPHTPVLPPKSYRERFQKHQYKIPEFDEEEMAGIPKQLKIAVENYYTDNMTDAEKQQMVQDYYAFCAYGDDLIGQAVDGFIEYSQKQKQPWVIVYVCGDHGWKLNDHGATFKCTPWEMDAHNPIIVASSDKNAFPANNVVRDYTEFVDIAPTILSAAGANIDDDKYDYLDGFDLKEVAAETTPKRDYIVGESHALIGPRAFIRTKEYAFSMQIRPDLTKGTNMDWAIKADYKDVDPALYHTAIDPEERNNLAFDKDYQQIAKKMREKLTNIVLGDNRVEIEWGDDSKALGTDVHRSNFAPGAHDYKLEL